MPLYWDESQETGWHTPGRITRLLFGSTHWVQIIWSSRAQKPGSLWPETQIYHQHGWKSFPGKQSPKGMQSLLIYRPTKGRWKMLWSSKYLLVPGHISKGTELWPLHWRYRYFRSIWKAVSYTAQNFLPQFSQGEYLISEFKENLHGFKKISRHELMSKRNLSPSRLRRNCGAEVGAQW